MVYFTFGQRLASLIRMISSLFLSICLLFDAQYIQKKYLRKNDKNIRLQNTMETKI